MSQLLLLADAEGRVVARCAADAAADPAAAFGWATGLRAGDSLVDALRRQGLAGDARAQALFTSVQTVLDGRQRCVESKGPDLVARLDAVEPRTPVALALRLQWQPARQGGPGSSPPEQAPAGLPFESFGPAGLHGPAEPTPPPRRQALIESLRRRHAGKHLLVADDDVIAREALVELLVDAGLQVDVADDGQAAVEQAARRYYDLVLLDLRMPRLDGLDAARTLRRLPGMAETPLVAVTANTFDDDRRACRDAGMTDFLPKPVVVEHLYETLLRGLERASPLPPPLTPAPAVPSTAAPSTPAPNSNLGPLLGLDGIDAPAGLAMVGGRVELYRRLLGVFVQSHADDPGRVQRALDDHDAEQAAAIAHRLRGSSATLGLVDVEAAAAQVEQACESGQPPLLPELAEALAGTVSRLRSALS